MNLIVAVFGTGLLIYIAILVGGSLDRQARDDAWRRVSRARRQHWEQLQAIRACEDCPLRYLPPPVTPTPDQSR